MIALGSLTPCSHSQVFAEDHDGTGRGTRSVRAVFGKQRHARRSPLNLEISSYSNRTLAR